MQPPSAASKPQPERDEAPVASKQSSSAPSWLPTQPSLGGEVVGAAETLREYADLLRIGSLVLNGREITWDTSSATDVQLKCFVSAFVGALKRLPEAGALEDGVLHQSAHLICKALSINYVLSEVISFLRARLGARRGELCSIKTVGDHGKTCLEYGVDVQPGRMMRVYVNWRGRGNIICCNPQTSKKHVKGTLSCVETEFPIAPEPGFKPTYRLRLELMKPRVSRLASKFVPACGTPAAASVEAVCPASSLLADSVAFADEPSACTKVCPTSSLLADSVAVADAPSACTKASEPASSPASPEAAAAAAAAGAALTAMELPDSDGGCEGVEDEEDEAEPDSDSDSSSVRALGLHDGDSPVIEGGRGGLLLGAVVTRDKDGSLRLLGRAVNSMCCSV